MEYAVRMFSMLAEATRVRLLWALLEGELSVGELAARVGKKAPSVSQHLAKLRMSGMVRTRRDGNQMLYRVANDHIGRVIVDAIQNAEHATDNPPTHHRTPAAWAAAKGGVTP